MATLTAVLPVLVSMGAKALRDRIVLSRYCNKDLSPTPVPFGSAINVAIPSAITAVEITPAYIPPTTTAVVPTAVSVTLSNWWEAPFELTDKNLLECDRGIIPMQASEAVKAIANKIEDTGFAKYAAIYGYAGTAGTTPFATDMTGFTAADKVLNDQLCPPEERYLCLSTAARANALNLTQVSNASYRGNSQTIATGDMGEIFGARWLYSQRVPTHASTGTPTHYWVNDSGNALAVGDTAVNVETDGSLTGYFNAGDVITFAGDTQTYTVVSLTGGTGATSALVISPGLKADPGNHAAITTKTAHVCNLLFHRDCFAFASAPLQDSNIAPNLVAMESIVDAESGIALRLEVTREYHRFRFAYDCMWGWAVPRPEFGCRLAG
jgi:hypothetical protein